MPTVVNSYKLDSTFGASPRSVTVNAVGSGSTVIVVVKVADSNQGAGVSVTDNQGNTYTQDLTFQSTTADADEYFFRASNITNAPTSVSCAFGSGNAVITFYIFEVSGLANSSPVDATASDASSTFSSTPSKSITTTTDSCLIVGALSLGVDRTFTPDTGWTALPATGSEYNFIAYDNDVGAAGSKTISGTLGSAVNWRWGVVAYKAAATSTAAKPAMHYARLRTA